MFFFHFPKLKVKLSEISKNIYADDYMEDRFRVEIRYPLEPP